VLSHAARTRAPAEWIAALPALVERLAREWGLTLGRSFGNATEAYVVAAGPAAVLKVPVSPGAEAVVLRLAGGEGCAALLRHDEASGAMLIERLGPPLSAAGLTLDARHEILCRVAQRLWRPAPDAGLRTAADRGREMAAYVEAAWERLGRPCSAAAVEQGLAAAERRAAAHDDERAVLLHGDVHQWNTLRAGDGWKLVDPDGLVGEPEHDLGVLIREDPVELLTGDPRDRSRRLAALTSTDEAAIWDWGRLFLVENGLSCLETGLADQAPHYLAAADRLAGSVG
jgi:streptomycin 6-kinase